MNGIAAPNIVHVIVVTKSGALGRLRWNGIRLVRVEGEGPAWEFEDRAVESLDLYADHVRSTAGAGDVPAHLVARYAEIVADSGAVGRYGPIDAPQAFLIATELRGHLIGADPLAIEAIHDRLLRVHRHGRAGMFVNAISAVNNALWDLSGKVRGEPVYRLLGGPTRETIPAYATCSGTRSSRHGPRRSLLTTWRWAITLRSGSSPMDRERVGKVCSETSRWRGRFVRPSAPAIR
jgi:L-alanine-DL-glutamate epimerase-like enolase superfamily enzyme